MFKLISQFKVVGDEKNLSKASEVLGISQPTLTLNITRLEKSLGIKLYIRKKHGIELTAIGEELHENASNVVKAYNHTLKSISSINNPSKKIFSIGCGRNWTHTYYLNFIKSAAEKFDNLMFKITDGESVALQKKLMSHDYDMIFGSIPYSLVRDDDICYIPVFKSGFSLFSCNNNKLASLNMVNETDIVGYQWVEMRHIEEIQDKDDSYTIYINLNNIKFSSMSLTTSLNLVKDSNYLIMLSNNLKEVAETHGLVPLNISDSVQIPPKFESGIMFLKSNKLAKNVANEIVGNFKLHSNN